MTTTVAPTADRVVIPEGVDAWFGPKVRFNHHTANARELDWLERSNQIWYLPRTLIVRVGLPEGHHILKDGQPLPVGTPVEVAVVMVGACPHYWIMNLGQMVDLGIGYVAARRATGKGSRKNPGKVPFFSGGPDDEWTSDLRAVVLRKLTTGYYHVIDLPDGYSIPSLSD